MDKETFQRYEKVRKEGLINMNDFKNVSLFAEISREEAFDIMKNYNKYFSEYFKSIKCDKCKQEVDIKEYVETIKGENLCFACDCKRLIEEQ